MDSTGFSRRRVLRTSGCGLAVTLLGVSRADAQSGWLGRSLERLEGLANGGSSLSEAQIGRGLREALEVASRTVVDQLGQHGAYLRDEAIRIPLPGFLGTAQSALQAAGAAGLLDDLEVRLNRAAESAAPQAQALFLDAIGEMTLADGRRILNGPDDAATRYFQRTMTPNLRNTFRPIVAGELQDAGALSAFDQVSREVERVPFVPSLGEPARNQLIDHGVEGALNGIFHYLAEEEAAIRNNPAKRTTDLLRDVFG